MIVTPIKRRAIDPPIANQDLQILIVRNSIRKRHALTVNFTMHYRAPLFFTIG